MVLLTSANGVSGPFYVASMALFLAGVGFGAAFIATSMSSNFFKWAMDSCTITGQLIGSDLIVTYDVDVEADIGWKEFMVTYIDPGAAGCFDTIEEGSTYSIGDFQDNSGVATAYGMVIAWVLAVIVGVVTIAAMFLATQRSASKGGMLLTVLSKWCSVLAVGIVVATTVFWWMIEGKFGDRNESLAARLQALVVAAADACNEGVNTVEPCKSAKWEMDAPGWSLSLGIAGMCCYAAGAVFLNMVAARTDAILNGFHESEVDPFKMSAPATAGAEKPQGRVDQSRPRDSRSARTGGRAPTSTVTGAPDGRGLDWGSASSNGPDEDEQEEYFNYHHR